MGHMRREHFCFIALLPIGSRADCQRLTWMSFLTDDINPSANEVDRTLKPCKLLCSIAQGLAAVKEPETKRQTFQRHLKLSLFIGH